MKNIFRITTLLFGVGFSLVIVEGVLFALKFEPSKIWYSDYFRLVESLKVHNFWCANNHGILVVCPKARDYIHQKIATNKPIKIGQDTSGEFQLINNYVDVLGGEDSTYLGKYYRTIKRRTGPPTRQESFIINYLQTPINEQGFRSLPFIEEFKSKKILLIGDSFTWGHSTKNKTSSFADNLLLKGYHVYNAGISGADLEQYHEIAMRYIPNLKPDVTIVNFFLGNDVSRQMRPIVPFRPIYYETNAGLLYSYQYGHYFDTPKKIYDFLVRSSTIPIYKGAPLVNTICAKTRFGTLIWRTLLKLELVSASHPEDLILWSMKDQYMVDGGYSNRLLRKIINIADKNNSKIKIVIIRDFKNNRVRTEQFPLVFDQVPHTYSPVGMEGYKENDDHFNEEGHLEYAKFLAELINN